MPNECIYDHWSSSERDWKWSPNVSNSLLNCIAWDSHRMVSEQDHGWVTHYQDSIWGLSGALPTEGTDWDVYATAYQNEYWTTILVGYRPAWPMVKEYDYNDQRAPFESHLLQERMLYTAAGVESYARGSGEWNRVWIYIVWMTIRWEAYEIDTRSDMIDHHRLLSYREQKLESTHRSQARIIRADWAQILLPKWQQWSLMSLACGVVHEELGKLEC